MEIKFKRDTSFRKQFFVPDSFAHPAKMDAQLLIWLTENYTNVGETVLDPMAGSGTMMLACTLGRNCILVELEEKFCKMMADNWAEVKMRPQLGSTMGDCQIIQGDARNLEGLLADKIITSPPYRAEPTVSAKYLKIRTETGRDITKPSSRYAKYADKIITSPPYSEGLGHQHRKYGRDIEASKSIQAPEYSRSPDNIGNLPYGDIDKIITSPPYAEAVSGGGIAKYGHFSDPELAKRTYSAENMNIKKQIKRVEEGKAKMKRPDVFTSEGNKAAKGFFEGNYSRDPENIGNLPYGNIDKIITSPPYEEAHDKKIGGLTDKDRPDLVPYSWVKTDNPQNIGNLKGDTYLEAMALVYSQCFTVLKDGGLLILVTKNFIRNKAVIRLDSDTIKLCEQAGFSFVERHFRRLPAQSFWRTIYQQKYPDVEVIQNEDILVFTKASVTKRG